MTEEKGAFRPAISKQEALDCLFNARSVAVVGASNDPAKFGYALMDTIRRAGYEGTIYPINRRAERVQGLPAYASVGQVPGAVDAAVILVPAPYVAGVIREAAGKGARAAAILSAGFSESGRPDLALEVERAAQACGVRLLGPNIQGYSYLPNRLCAMFWPAMTTPGPLAVVAQSGSVTAALAEWAAEEGLGISAAVNLGNQMDIDAADLLAYFGQDAHTRAVALHVESIGNGRRFLDVARRVARSTPVAILKSGRTASGRRAAASHTGALAGNDRVFDAACRQVGLVRADDLAGLYDTAKALATLRRPSGQLPSGKRLLILSTSGGGATLAADAAERCGLVLPRLPEALVEALRGLDPPSNASLSNPLDLPSLSASLFEGALRLADSYDLADVYLLSFGDPVPDSAEAVQRLAGQVRGSLAVAYFGGGEVERRSRVKLQQAGIPVYPTPERAVQGIAAAVWAGSQARTVEGEEDGGWFSRGEGA